MKLDKKTHDRLNELLIRIVYNQDVTYYDTVNGIFVEVDAEQLRYMAWFLSPELLTPWQDASAQILLETGKW